MNLNQVDDAMLVKGGGLIRALLSSLVGAGQCQWMNSDVKLVGV